VTSPVHCREPEDPDNYGICIVQKGENRGGGSKQKFKEYLREKLAHLQGKYRQILEPVLQKYCHLFYGIGSTDIGCTGHVQHVI
jgi:hypothetical protein